MKKCDKCLIEIETNQKYCPLCHQVLVGSVDPDFKEIYPEFISVNKKILPITKKILMFSTMISILVLILINWLTYNGMLWSLIPIGSIIYFWFLMRVGILSVRNVAFRIAFLTTLLIALLILVDFRSVPENNGWSIDYLMPLLLVSSNLAIFAMLWIKRLNYRDYFFYLLIILLFSIAPLFLMIFNVVTTTWPSIVAFSAAIAIILFLAIFFPKSIKEEIKKRFHA